MGTASELCWPASAAIQWASGFSETLPYYTHPYTRPACICTRCMPSALKRQKRILDGLLPPLELELIVLSCHVGPRNWIQILCKNSKCSSLLGQLCSTPPIAFLKWQRFQGSLNADWQPNDFYALCVYQALSGMGHLWRKVHTVWVNIGGLHAAVYLLKRTPQVFIHPSEQDGERHPPW